VAKKYPVNIALHTDHCPKDKLDGFVRPLLASPKERRGQGRRAAVPVAHVGRLRGTAGRRTSRSPRSCSADCAAAKVILEIEVGVVGGEEDGIVGAIDEKLYSTRGRARRRGPALGLGEKGDYMAAFTFGNVHGVYKPGNVKLRPEILKEIQDAVGAKYGVEKPFNMVFHGGSGSLLSEIRSALDYGVVKMNIDTDTQYAFTRPTADHMFHNYDGVLKVDGEVGSKKAYDPRTWGKLAEEGMAKRVVQACEDLRSAGTAIK
jgi:fructose-bisphosphate aldolase class II